MKAIKIILAFFLFLCLLKMPYSYYEIMRWVVVIGCTILAVSAFSEKRFLLAFIFVGIVILFQPIHKFYIHKETWHTIDIIIGCFLVIHTLAEKWIRKYL